MAVAFDAYSESAANTDPADITHTPVGTPRGVVVFAVQTNIANEISGVTYGGSALTELAGSPLTEGTEGLQVRAYFLGSSVPTGAQTVAFSVTGTTGTKVFYVITLTGSADLETVDVDATIATNSIADPSVTLSLGGRTSWCGIVGMSGHGAVTSITPLTGWTARDENTTGSECVLCYTYDTVGATDVTAGWTQTAEDAVMIAVAISEVAAASGLPGLVGQRFGLAGPRGLAA